MPSTSNSMLKLGILVLQWSTLADASVRQKLPGSAAIDKQGASSEHFSLLQLAAAKYHSPEAASLTEEVEQANVTVAGRALKASVVNHKGLSSTLEEDPEHELLVQGPDRTFKAHEKAAKSAIDSIKEVANWTGLANLTGPEAAVNGTQPYVNTSEDLGTLLSALSVHGSVCVLCVLIFLWLRRVYPIMYSYRTMQGKAPEKSTTGCCSCLGIFCVSVDEAEEYAGLDAAMLLEFCNLCMKITFVLGFPLCAALAPLYARNGAEVIAPPTANSTVDWLSLYSASNLTKGSQVYVYLPLVVWFVVIVVQRMIWAAHERFVVRRYRWLKGIPKPRATTLMVSDIPEKYQSDAALLNYYQSMFPDGVERAYVVKRTGQLRFAVEEERLIEQRLHEAEHTWKLGGKRPESRPKFRPSFYGDETVDSILYHSQVLEQATQAVSNERERVHKLAAKGDSSIYCAEGFVTFKTRRDLEIALNLQLNRDAGVFKQTYAPAPTDIRYDDLLRSNTLRQLLKMIGYFFVAILYFGFFPIIGALSSVANLQTLRTIPVVNSFFISHPHTEALAEGVFATFALFIFMSFLPSVLVFIFRTFFTLKADSYEQVLLMRWYFWFQVIYVLLITAVGSSLWTRLEEVIKSPTSVMTLLANTLPSVSHFYMSYIVLNWASNCMQLLRYANLFKFLAWKRICTEERAKRLSEPEDQEYYGMGGRMARFGLIMVTGLVFSVLVPFILPLTFIHFVICRVVYGYLLVYAETPKTDLGGEFWVLQLKNLRTCMLIFVFMMGGIIFSASEAAWPGWVALSSALYLIFGDDACETIAWEQLPFDQVMSGDEKDARSHMQQEEFETHAHYVQEELLPPEEALFREGPPSMTDLPPSTTNSAVARATSGPKRAPHGQDQLPGDSRFVSHQPDGQGGQVDGHQTTSGAHAEGGSSFTGVPARLQSRSYLRAAPSPTPGSR
eukprot:TRINITY_DN91273_c0_g1_i1.p1 TRINITY_DN91273_c0_g1~~TRINITY_DN91273_c0_g1_i1.p1  ORF type:complete len:954 (-),score=107.66 TRINITY_DN91273_c0_g1_i1:58-2919(-)